MEKKEQTRLTASEARQIAETSLCMLNNMYSMIRAAAKTNRTSIEWIIDDNTPAKVTDSILVSLKENGYTVTQTNNDTSNEKSTILIIKW